jgi:hypothetical protein
LSNAGTPKGKTSICTNTTGTVHDKLIRLPKKWNIAASTSVYMKMVNNQLLENIY